MSNESETSRRTGRRRWGRWVASLLLTLGLGLLLSPGVTLRDPEPGSGPLDAFAVDPTPAPEASAPAWTAAPSRETPPAPPAAREAPAPAQPAEPPSTLDCLLEPSELVAVGSPVAGVIDVLSVERSDAVEAGQVLVELEATVERAEVELASARAVRDARLKARRVSLALGERRRARAERLFASDALSLDERDEVETEARMAQLELEQAEEEVRVARLQLARVRAELARRTIRSPISGVVVERLRTPGERVEDEPILRVAQIDPLYVEAILPAAAFGSVKAGMRAAVVPEVPGDRVYVASVSVVDPVIDAASGTFGVRLELPNADHEIPSGLRCQLRLLPAGDETSWNASHR